MFLNKDRKKILSYASESVYIVKVIILLYIYNSIEINFPNKKRFVYINKNLN